MCTQIFSEGTPFYPFYPLEKSLPGPSTMEPFVPIRAQLGAQDMPSVIQGAQDTPSVNQGARPAISTEQTMQSTQRYGTLPYVLGRLRHPCRTVPCLLC